MGIDKELIDQLLANYKGPEDPAAFQGICPGWRGQGRRRPLVCRSTGQTDTRRFCANREWRSKEAEVQGCVIPGLRTESWAPVWLAKTWAARSQV